MPNPSALVRKQTEAVSSQFDSKKAEIIGQIDGQIEKQIDQVKTQGEAQLSAIEGKISELSDIKDQMDPTDPRREQIVKQIGMLKEQKKQVKAQIKMAIAQVKVQASREKMNIKTRLEREKEKAITQAVGAALAQFSMMMQQKRAEAEGATNDELKSGNRG